MIATLCQAVEREYGFIVTRLFRVFKPAESEFCDKDLRMGEKQNRLSKNSPLFVFAVICFCLKP